MKSDAERSVDEIVTMAEAALDEKLASSRVVPIDTSCWTVCAIPSAPSVPLDLRPTIPARRWAAGRPQR